MFGEVTTGTGNLFRIRLISRGSRGGLGFGHVFKECFQRMFSKNVFLLRQVLQVHIFFLKKLKKSETKKFTNGNFDPKVKE